MFLCRACCGPKQRQAPTEIEPDYDEHTMRLLLDMRTGRLHVEAPVNATPSLRPVLAEPAWLEFVARMDAFSEGEARKAASAPPEFQNRRNVQTQAHANRVIDEFVNRLRVFLAVDPVAEALQSSCGVRLSVSLMRTPRFQEICLCVKRAEETPRAPERVGMAAPGLAVSSWPSRTARGPTHAAGDAHYCHKCGASYVMPDAQFCNKCGTAKVGC
jgi:hypothetical protein